MRTVSVMEVHGERWVNISDLEQAIDDWLMTMPYPEDVESWADVFTRVFDELAP